MQFACVSTSQDPTVAVQYTDMVVVEESLRTHRTCLSCTTWFVAYY